MPKTVMIVEDNELNMKLFRDLLEAHGYHTIGTQKRLQISLHASQLLARARPTGASDEARSQYRESFPAGL